MWISRSIKTVSFMVHFRTIVRKWHLYNRKWTPFIRNFGHSNTKLYLRHNENRVYSTMGIGIRADPHLYFLFSKILIILIEHSVREYESSSQKYIGPGQRRWS